MIEDEKALPRAPRKVGVREFRGNFAGFMRQVRHGASFAVTARNEVIALVHPPQPAPRRRPGALRGQIEMAPDFDVLSPELLAAMEGEEG
ncbi:prevent-host-death protein [Methylobacterium sp. M6A4_1b]